MPFNNNQVRARVAMCVLGSVVAGGCVGTPITTVTDRPLSMTAPASITVTPLVSLLAVGGTQQLNLSGVTFGGTPVTTFDSVLYQYVNAGDSIRVQLSNTGLITGRTAGPNTILITVLGYKGTGLVGDRVLTQVTDAVIPGLVLSIQPTGVDSATLALGNVKTIVPILQNPTTGVGVTNPAMEYRVKGTQDSIRVDVFRPGIFVEGKAGNQDEFCVRPARSTYVRNGGLQTTNWILPLTGEGAAWVYAEMNAYGTVLRDSVLYTFTYPYTTTISTVKANLRLVSLYGGQVITLARGATVAFQNGGATTDPLTMVYTFDNPVAAMAASSPSTIGGASGNVTTLTGGQTSNRRFLTSGTYRWTMVASGGPAPWPGQTVSGTLLIK